jgi:pimeloyl-ACP methyl ester carboxylesterase
MQIFEKDGLKLNYSIIGSGKPLLFLHGAIFSSKTYCEVIKLLAKKYQIIAPDLPCFGKSDVPREVWNFDDYADFLGKFISWLKIRDVVLVGHSFGGGVALRLAASNDRISKLILIDSAGFDLKCNFGVLCLRAIRKQFNELVYYDKKVSFRLLNEVIRGFIFKKFRYLSRIIKTLNRCVFSNNDAIEGIRIPTLILWAKNDEVIYPDKAEVLHNIIKGSIVQYVEGNHDWCLYRPGVLSKYVSF